MRNDKRCPDAEPLSAERMKSMRRYTECASLRLVLRLQHTLTMCDELCCLRRGENGIIDMQAAAVKGAQLMGARAAAL